MLALEWPKSWLAAPPSATWTWHVSTLPLGQPQGMGGMGAWVGVTRGVGWGLAANWLKEGGCADVAAALETNSHLRLLDLKGGTGGTLSDTPHLTSFESMRFAPFDSSNTAATCCFLSASSHTRGVMGGRVQAMVWVRMVLCC